MNTIALYLLMSLHPFETDLCTFWPEGPRREPQKWAECCVMHDLNYWVGGTQRDRKEADLDLRACVTKIHSESMGNLMYFGIRAGRLSPIKLKGKGWGFAWPKDRANDKPLTLEEIGFVEEELVRNHPHVEIEDIAVFIQHLKDRQN